MPPPAEPASFTLDLSSLRDDNGGSDMPQLSHTQSDASSFVSIRSGDMGPTSTTPVNKSPAAGRQTEVMMDLRGLRNSVAVAEPARPSFGVRPSVGKPAFAPPSSAGVPTSGYAPTSNSYVPTSGYAPESTGPGRAGGMAEPRKSLMTDIQKHGGKLAEDHRVSMADRQSVFSMRMSDGGLLDESGEVDLFNLAKNPVKQVRMATYGVSGDDGPVSMTMGGMSFPNEDSRSNIRSNSRRLKSNTPMFPLVSEEDTEDWSTQGPTYNQQIHTYYCKSGGWSDGLCAACEKPALALACCFPLCWPYRLYQTLQRASPLDIRLPNGGSACYTVTTGNACAVATGTLMLFYLLCLGGGGGGWVLAGVLEATNGTMTNATIPAGETEEEADVMVKGVLAFSFFLLAIPIGAIMWALLLLAVGRKYKVGQAEDTPCSFLCKAMCCICATNIRVGLHTDRAQGFTKAQRAVRDRVDDAEQMELRAMDNSRMSCNGAMGPFTSIPA